MNSFVRFILVLLVMGSAIAFGIVLWADVHGARNQAADLEREKALFSEVVERYSGKQAHGLIAVEWQKTDGNQQVMESSLLVRLFSLNAEGKESPLPIQRVVIPQDRVAVEGLLLNFDYNFSDEYAPLRGKSLTYIHFIHADGAPRGDGLSFLVPYKVPRATQMHEDRATQFEMQLWSYLWDLILVPRDGRHGLSVTPDPSTWPVVEPGKAAKAAPMTESDRRFIAARKVSNGGIYSVYVSADGASIVENNDPALFNDMREEMKLEEAEKARKAAGEQEQAMLPTGN
ncbi:MAG: hypothetical protein ACTHN5_16935 [Phycisphaerae bacterium]